MSMRRVVLKSATCAQCRVSIIGELASLSNAELRQSRQVLRSERFFSTSTRAQQPRARGGRSRFADDDLEPLVPGTNGVSTSRASFKVAPSFIEAAKSHSHEETRIPHEPVEDTIKSIEPKRQPPTTSNLPWYLQDDAPIRQSEDSPLAPRQQIPDLPPHPPPILPTLLDRISVDLGLDDLNLLDLRNIDPPPALGSNLIMIIGTARSEKHLHVSADRFCRYLRSEHKLSPHAAGLLGRNELKIKLRRKAKRMKLMANVGAQQTGSIDDGIRTGWICLTVGRVPAAPDAPKKPKPADFVGFDEEEEGVDIVVQMFVEEKRGEIDLEGLWGKIERDNNTRLRAAELENERQEADASNLSDNIESVLQDMSLRQEEVVASRATAS